jgi:hypothetical protein
MGVVTFLNPKNDGFPVSTPATTTLRDGLRPCRTFSYRDTEMGALTLTIVYDPMERAIIRPHRTELSKSGTHGQHIYCLPDWSKVWVITLLISNSDKRDVRVSGNMPSDVANKVITEWLMGAPISRVIEVLKSA